MSSLTLAAGLSEAHLLDAAAHRRASGLGGVQRKRAEWLAVTVAGSVAPAYHCLPPLEVLLEDAREGEDADGIRTTLLDFLGPELGWMSVPSEADPGGSDHPDASASALPAKRIARKRDQIMSLVRCCAVLMLGDSRGARGGGAAHSKGEKGEKVAVDFCGGQGHVGLLLAHLFPDWEIVCVDNKERSLTLGAERAARLGLRNYRTVLSDVRAFDEAFAVGVALHACGAATDYTLAACVKAKAGLVVCPCCVGKLSHFDERNVFLSAKAAPQGEALREALAAAVAGGGGGNALSDDALSDDALSDDALSGGAEGADAAIEEAYLELAKAADFGGEVEGEVGWWRRLCKTILECDRQQGLGGYTSVLCKMEPLTASPKNDVIVAWPSTSPPHENPLAFFPPDPRSSTFTLPTQEEETGERRGDFDASANEVVAVRARLAAFQADLRGGGRLEVHEPGGARGRKLVHSLAEALGLAHRSEGKGATRFVVVRKLEGGG